MQSLSLTMFRIPCNVAFSSLANQSFTTVETVNENHILTSSVSSIMGDPFALAVTDGSLLDKMQQSSASWGSTKDDWSDAVSTSHFVHINELIEEFLSTRVITAICILGIAGNLLNLIVLTRHRLRSSMERLEKTAHVGLVALATSDLTLLSYSLTARLCRSQHCRLPEHYVQSHLRCLQ